MIALSPVIISVSMGNIVRNPNILGGKPLVKGTRISVNFILEQLACGATIDDLLEGYPQLTRTLIQEALAYAAEDLQRMEVRTFSIRV